RFDGSTVELDRPRPSYARAPLRALRAAHAHACELYFLLGADAANTLPDWREPAELLRLARLVVMTRSDVRQPDWAVLRAIAPDAAQRVDVLAVPDIDLSSSDLRRRVAAGEPIRYQVPEPVRAYIDEHGLYVTTR